ncbi:hypothetical protein RYZ27_07845 [Hyphomonas sp. FCG-A18]|uniref:hypothetical protein n=1 Tax=Hyphomonas sp. FCG-A18 TaxID=3080019 RepID=UPI002B2AB2BD|nr:hypothetical protein RYZ27_07845 [Hyphomonas sp. FCG-A18]
MLQDAMDNHLKHLYSISVLAVLIGCTINGTESTPKSDSKNGCRTVYQSIYQPPVVAGQAGTMIRVPVGEECDSSESSKTSTSNALQAPLITHQINVAQRESISALSEHYGTDFDCVFEDRGRKALDAVECAKRTGNDLCWQGQFRDGKLDNRPICFSTPMTAKLIDTTMVTLGPTEKHLLQSWRIWETGTSKPVVYNSLFVNFYDQGWELKSGGFGDPPDSLAVHYAPLLARF